MQTERCSIDFTSQQLKKSLSIPDYDNSIFLGQTKSPLSPWYVRRKSITNLKDQRRNCFKHSKQKTEKSQQFLQKIRERNNHRFKTHNRRNTEIIQTQNCRSILQENMRTGKIKQKENSQQFPSLLFFPLNLSKQSEKISGNVKLKTQFGQSWGHPKTRMQNSFRTVKPVKVSPKLETSYRSSQQNCQAEDLSKITYISTFYKRGIKKTMKLKSKKISSDRRSQEKFVQGPSKKLSLEEVYKLLGNRKNSQNNYINNQTNKNQTQPFEYPKYSRNRKSIEQIAVKLNIHTDKLPQNINKDKHSYPQSGWLAPRSAKHPKSIKNSKYVCKTVYI